MVEEADLRLLAVNEVQAISEVAAASGPLGVPCFGANALSGRG